MMTHFKKAAIEYLSYFWEQKLVLLAYVALVFIITFTNLHMDIDSMYGLENQVSIADCLVLSASGFPLCLNFVVFPCIIIFLITKYDFQLVSVTRYKTINKLWLKHTALALIVAISNVIINLIVTLIVCAFYASVAINFDKTFSIFGLVNNGKILNDPSFINLLLIVVAFCLIVNIFYCILFSLLQWLIKNRFFIFVIIIFMGFTDMCNIGICSDSNVYFDKLLNYNPVGLLVPIIGIGIIFFLGYFCSNKKEFLNAE